jgi:hypothetical protein
MDAIDRLKDQHSGDDNILGNLGQKEAHSSQPEARRNTLDPSNINHNVLSSTRRDINLGFGAGFGSAFKTGQTNYDDSARHRTPPGGKPPGGSESHTERRNPPGRTPLGGSGSHARRQTSPGGPPPGGPASNAGQQNSRDGSPPGGSEVSSRVRGSRTRNQDITSQDNMLAGVLKHLTGQMANMTQKQSYLGEGHSVKEAYDAYVPTAYKSEFYLEKLPAPWNVMPRIKAKDSEEIKVIDSIFKNKFNGLEDGSYFMWRPEVIDTIHTANLLVQRKYMFITKFLDRKEARLAAMCIFTTFTASTYVDVIQELELTYG